MRERALFKSSADVSKVIKDLIKYYDLGYVLDNLESIIMLPIPYKNPGVSKQEYFENKQISMDIFSKIESVLEAFKSELDLRKSTFDEIKRQCPNFCSDMNRKIDSQTYQEYLELLKSCSKSIDELIKNFKDRKDRYQELLLDKKDDVSRIIDTEINSRLSYIQDNFVLQELDTIDFSKMTPQTQENAAKIRRDLSQRIANYNNFLRLYSSKNVIEIKPNAHNSSKER